MMPFCTESSSVGSPSIAQSPTVASSTMKAVTPRPGVSGTPRAVASASKRSRSSSVRKSALKGPAYPMKAHASATSPVSRLVSSANAWLCAVHRACSPLRPPMSLFAASIRRCVASASAWIAALSAIAASNCTCIASSEPCTTPSSAIAASSFRLATASLPIATLSSAILGLTTLAMCVYVTIALTHTQRPATLLETFFASSKVKSGAERYG